ncbi:MAG: hypothetical protein Q8N23_31490 [Archangium sp.]|nr:hypothetical protein [Archangium sp.]MDP3157238.1 hypothetical protein [Archangium sp.]MDP3576251.1 hypothetical protein [Archangium sp.]
MSARVFLLCSVLALGARAQSLSLQGAPLTLRLGGRTQGVTVERRAANGLPVTSGNTMVVVTAPPGGEVSLGPEPFSAWSPMVTVTILPGSSQSPPVFLRSGRRGLADWSAMAAGSTSAVATVVVRDDALTCDLESGTSLDTELPPGCFNVSIAPYPQSSMSISMAAAHRGSFGVRLIDGQSAPGNAADTALFDDTAPMFGDFHARSWVRVVATNGMGAPIIAQLTNAQGQSPSLIDLKLRPNLDLVMGGFGADAGYSEFSADAGLSLGAWHLLEFTVTGAGTSDGGRAVWLDGRLVLEQRSVDFSGPRMSVGRLAVGEPYADDRRWLGTIDFDDVRSAGVPLASRLEVQAPGAGFLGECLPFEVQARASLGGGLASLGESAPIELDAGGGASLFVDPSCAVPGDQVVMPPAASVTSLSFRATQPTFVILATTPDLLSGSRGVTVLAPPPMSIAPSQARVRPGEVVAFSVAGGTGRGLTFRMTANPSGGSVDSTGRYVAGTTTGGIDGVEARDSAGQTAVATVDVFAGDPDAGVADAGVADAGVADAGSEDAGAEDAGFAQPPRTLGVGCGCSTSSAPALGLLLLALSAWRRRASPMTR